MRLFPRQEVTFQGTKGMIRVGNGPFNAGTHAEAQVYLYRNGEPDAVWRFSGARQYRLQVECFGRRIREGGDYPWTLEDARGSQAMIDMVWANETIA